MGRQVFSCLCMQELNNLYTFDLWKGMFLNLRKYVLDKLAKALAFHKLFFYFWM
jgi:hypothetical protein